MDNTTLDFFPSRVWPLMPFLAFVDRRESMALNLPLVNLPLVPILRGATLATKGSTARPDRASVGVVGFDHRFFFGLHNLVIPPWYHCLNLRAPWLNGTHPGFWQRHGELAAPVLFLLPPFWQSACQRDVVMP